MGFHTFERRAKRAGAGPGERAFHATLNYLRADQNKPEILVDAGGPGVTKRTGRYTQRSMVVRDGRALAGRFDLDRAGFAFGRYPTRVDDFDDDEKIHATLYPEIEAILKWETGAESVVIFDHTVRTSDGTTDAARRTVAIVHNDYSETSGPRRAAEVLATPLTGAELPRRYAIVNAWRPIGAPVQRDPLGLVDARSVRTSDLRPVDIVYRDRRGEILEAGPADRHTWYWFPRMRPDELLLFKQFDTREDVARFTPHSAFTDPNATPDAPPRRSIELRALVVFPE